MSKFPAVVFGFGVLALSWPALAHDPCIAIQVEVVEASRGRDSPDETIRAAWRADHAAYDDARRRLDVCHNAVDNATPRQVGGGPQQAPAGVDER